MEVDTVTTGTAPVPVKLMVCVLPETPLALSVSVIAPGREPVAEGVKVTLIVQLPDAATLPPQLPEGVVV